jgi:hypothetical protein
MQSAEPRTLKAGLCFGALGQPQFCLSLGMGRGTWGCAGQGRSRGPPLLHWSSEKHMVVAGLGYTPNTPRTEVQNPVCSPVRRGSLVWAGW